MAVKWGSALLSLLAISVPALASPGGEPVAGTSLVRHQVQDRFGRTIVYYASVTKTQTPVLLMIQGSGCSTVIHDQGKTHYSTLFDLLPFAAEGKFTVVAVEKPYAQPRANGGTATDCGAAFNRDFTAERWLVAIQAALTDVGRQPMVDKSRTLVLGVSEGAVMASLLAGRDPRITDAVVVSGSGTTQLFDFVAGAYEHCFDRSRCLAEIEQQAADITADPTSVTKFAWGHPYNRWSSFFAVDPADELSRSRARIYLAFGTADASVPALSEEVAVAKLLATGKRITIRRVPDANHSLIQPDSTDLSALDAEYRRALSWFWLKNKP